MTIASTPLLTAYRKVNMGVWRGRENRLERERKERRDNTLVIA